MAPDGVVQLDAEPALAVVHKVHAADEPHRAVALDPPLGEVAQSRGVALPQKLVARGHLQKEMQILC